MFGIAATRHQIKNDQPGLHDFRRFLRQFELISLKFCRGHFLLKS